MALIKTVQIQSAADIGRDSSSAAQTPARADCTVPALSVVVPV